MAVSRTASRTRSGHDDGDDDASPAGFGVGHASYKAAFPNAASSGPGGK